MMSRQRLTRESLTLVVSIVFLSVGIVALWIMKTWLDMQQDVVLVAILLIPILAYMMFSGRLQEIHGPGGLSATFIDMAHTPLLDKEESNATERIEVGQVGIVEKGGISDLQQMLPKVSNSSYIVLTVTLGKVDHYEETTLLNYLKALSQYRNFIFLVILDQCDEVFAYLAGWRAMQIIEMEMQMEGPGLVHAIKQGSKQDLLRYELIRITARTKDTNLNVLKLMTELKMSALIVADENHKLKGVVEREQVLSKLALAYSTPIQ